MFYFYLLYSHHYNVHDSNVVNRPSDKPGFIEVSFYFADFKANFDSPEKKEKFPCKDGKRTTVLYMRAVAEGQDFAL